MLHKEATTLNDYCGKTTDGIKRRVQFHKNLANYYVKYLKTSQ